MFFRCLLLSLAWTPLLNADIFSSVHDLTTAFTVERSVMNALTNYLAKTEDRLLKLRKYLETYKQVQAEAVEPTENPFETAEHLAENPLFMFHLIKRLTLDWKNIEEYDPVADWKEVESEIAKGEIFGFSDFHNEQDLAGAAQALVRLQSIYEIDTAKLVQGNVLGVKTTPGLTMLDCIYLGKQAFSENDFGNALKWFEEALSLAVEEGNKTALEAVIGHLNTTNSYYQPGINPILNMDDSAKKYQLGELLSQVDIDRNFAALCRGEQLLDDAYIATLKCFYDHRNIPYLRLMPAKVEKHHHKPEILVFHDAITEKEMKRIKEVSIMSLARATVLNSNGKDSIVSNVRTSKHAWMDAEIEYSVFRNLMTRSTQYTGLDTSPSPGCSERLQTANYGIGGHYVPHRDYLFQDLTQEQKSLIDYNDTSQGDRIATYMFYLSGVKKGGATVFPHLGVSVFPQKGSASFWYNLKKSGERDLVSLHAGCPVVHGSKWVGNKWIRELQQFRNRPCGLSYDD